MQILFNSSEESKVPGLSIFPDKLVKINNPIVRVPHQGWNFAIYNKNNTTLKNIFEKKFYFSHSFWLQNFNEDESVGIEKTLNNITESISILVEKKLDLFSSTVNNK